MEKVVDNEELMEFMRVVYVHSGKDLKIAWKEKMHGKK